MKKSKFVFRIAGALFSSLIILSVFMPFTKMETLSLWDIYHSADKIYLPIMIVVFGSIGVLFFSLNIKTEFAYATSGAIIFFTVMQFVQAYGNDAVGNLGLGFYFLAIGGVMTGLMAFLSNLREKVKAPQVQASPMPVMGGFVASPALEPAPAEKPVVPEQATLQNDQTLETVKAVEAPKPIPNIVMDNSLNANTNMAPIHSNNAEVPMEPNPALVGQPSVPTESIPEIVNNPVEPKESMSIPEVVSEPPKMGSLESRPIVTQNATSNNFNAQVNSFTNNVNPSMMNPSPNQAPVMMGNQQPNANMQQPNMASAVMRSSQPSPSVSNENTTNMQNLDIFGNFK